MVKFIFMKSEKKRGGGSRALNPNVFAPNYSKEVIAI